MKTKRMAALAVAGVTTSLLAAAPAGAGVSPIPGLELEVTPTSGPGGTVVTVSGSDCVVDDVPGEVEFGLADFGNFTPVVFDVAVPDVDGNWTGQFTVPPGTDPEGTYAVGAECVIEVDEGEFEPIVEYFPVEFDVTGDGPTPTTAPPATTPPTTGPGTPEVPTPPPATPVVRPPDQTG